MSGPQPDGPAPPRHAAAPTRAWARPSPVDSPAGPPPPSPRRSPGRRSYWLLVGAVVLVAVAALVVAGLQFWSGGASATLTLTTSEVRIGESYFATAAGLDPREPVRFSWAGPTTGEMGTFPADDAGDYRHGPIVERDPPGAYTITAMGLSSGRTASAGLQVLPAAGAAGP